MIKIKFADNSEIEVLANTAVYPSMSASNRSRMEIHLAENAMALDAFEALFSNEAKTASIHLINTENGSDVTYSNYSIVASIGKKSVATVNYQTGATASEMQLVVELEQLTYIEQQLKALGIKF